MYLTLTEKRVGALELLQSNDGNDGKEERLASKSSFVTIPL